MSVRRSGRVASCLILLVAGVWSLASHAVVVSIDQFLVARNGVPFFTDNFSDGVPPPSAPNFAGGGPASYNVSGTIPGGAEAGGVLQLDSANGALTANAAGVLRRNMRVRLLTNIDPNNLAAGLKIDDTLSLTGIFSLTIPTGEFNPLYAIRFNDAAGAGASQILQLEVNHRTQSNETQIRWILQDFVAGTINVLGTAPFAPPVGADQVLLNITRPDTATANFFGSYSYLSAGVVVGGDSFATPGQMFQHVNFVRAEFNAADGFAPRQVAEPGTFSLAFGVLLLLASGRARGLRRRHRDPEYHADKS
jgi:hypothetical protein